MNGKTRLSLTAGIALLTLPFPALAQNGTPAPVPSPSPAPQAALPASGTPPPPAKPLLRDSLLAAPPLVIALPTGRSIQIGGFIYGRYDQANSGDRTGTPAFPEGSGTPNGYNGNGDGGFNNSTFKIREGRLFAQFGINANAKALVEVSSAGAANTTPNGQPATGIFRRVYGQYTFGDGKADKLTITAGQFWNPFGFAINNPLPFWYTPERPLLGKESARGLWENAEFDRGVQLSLAPKDAYFALAVVNGTGWTSNDTNRARDIVLRARKFYPQAGVSFGGSYYSGTFAAGVTTGTGTTAVTTIKGDAERSLFGLDLQYTSPNVQSGPYLQAEYVGGTLEAIAPITLGDPRASTPTYPSSFVSGNKIEGYSLIGGWTFGKSSAHPWSLIGLYDVLKRSKSIATQQDVNYGFGASYNLSPGVKTRLFWTQPNKVAYAAGTTAPEKVGLFTADLMFVL